MHRSDDYRRPFLDLVRNEVLVDVGRDGELLSADGRHRFSIAKLLDIDKIPVAFAFRHTEWMQRREVAYLRGTTASHPDLTTMLGYGASRRSLRVAEPSESTSRCCTHRS